MEHARAICPQAMEYKYWKGDEWRKWAEEAAVLGTSYAGYLDGELMMAGGVNIFEEGKGWVWAIFSHRIKSHKIETLRAVKKVIGFMIEYHELKELWTRSNKSFAASQRLLKHLGFEKMGDADERHYTYVLRC